MIRNIVRIDVDKCNGCGQCADACQEAAIQIINGKARLVSETYCDGLGACLGECPQDAITIEQREAAEFSQEAVEERLGNAGQKDAETRRRGDAAKGRQRDAERGTKKEAGQAPLPCGCPGSMARDMSKDRPAAKAAVNCGCPTTTCGDEPSELINWPLQLALVSPNAPYFRNADLLVAADCTGFVLPGFHHQLLACRPVVIACPKLDDVEPYAEKLAAIFAGNDLRSITVAHMEVPCCSGIVRLVQQAMSTAGINVPVRDVTVGIDGRIVQDVTSGAKTA